ncbi:LBF_2804 family protein [Larkinella rosea]|uniref:Uncharacterized protein n=1 Tax=Larkinella rosea TaxID=2025312 RepID=A0A3P1BUP8_9BACT|nr:hypothetical protein [Larkinella rosea]RRB04830.1 hypothetical protein EHT25_15320 [Larkinella rosea]
MSDSTDSTGDFDQATTGRTTLRYLARAMHTDHPSDEPFVLNETERQAIYRIKGATMLVASALGMIGIWAFYLPHVFWEKWFTETHTALGDWPLISILFAVLVFYLILHTLILLHTGAVRLVELTCQFPRFHDAAYARHMNQLAENANQRGSFRLRITPRPLLPWTLSGFLLTVLLLILVNNGLLHLAIRFWGAGAVSSGTAVLISTLVAAGWICWATYCILKQAQIRVMAPLTIRQFTNELAEEFGREPAFRQLIPGILQQAAVSSKPDNYPQLLLLEAITARFSPDPLEHSAAGNAVLLQQLANCPDAVRHGLERVFIFSILIDGHLSSLERKRFLELQNARVLTVSETDVEAMRRNFVKGDGLWV